MKIQKLSHTSENSYALARKYYQIMSVLNDLKLAEGQIQLIAFTAIHGNISDPDVRTKYCKKYKTTPATINNIVDKMKKKKVIMKEDKVLFVNPALTAVPFDESLGLVISLSLEPVNLENGLGESDSPQEKTREQMEKENKSILNVNKHG
jgi:hypothetical protein